MKCHRDQVSENYIIIFTKLFVVPPGMTSDRPQVSRLLIIFIPKQMPEDVHYTVGWVDFGTSTRILYVGDLLDFMKNYGKLQKKRFLLNICLTERSWSTKVIQYIGVKKCFPKI
jgi:hypothetical protein